MQNLIEHLMGFIITILFIGLLLLNPKEKDQSIFGWIFFSFFLASIVFYAGIAAIFLLPLFIIYKLLTHKSKGYNILDSNRLENTIWEEWALTNIRERPEYFLEVMNRQYSPNHVFSTHKEEMRSYIPIAEKFLKLKQKEEELKKSKENNMSQLMSDQIDQLATALAKAQGEMSVAGKNQKNPFFKSNYADFEAIIAASRPALTKYGLSVVQPPFMCDGSEGKESCLVTILMHSSGQWIKSISKHNPPKTDIQALSSYNTSLKRMCYTSLICVATGDDDDGENAMDRNNQQHKSAELKQEPKITVCTELPKSPSFSYPRDMLKKSEPIKQETLITEKISKDQLEQLEHDLDGYADIKEKVITALNIDRLNDMPRVSFLKASSRIRELVQQEQDIKNKK